MHPMLIEALVEPRLDDLRRSARRSRAAALPTRSAAPAAPLPAWAVAIRPRPVAAVVAAPCGCGGDPA